MRLLPLLLVCAAGCASTRLVARVTPSPPGAYLVQNVNVFDGEQAVGLRDVRIFDGKIDAVAEAGTLQPSDGEELVSGEGRTLLPGLVDAHAHIETHGEPIWAVGLPRVDDIAQAYLYAGVTSALIMQGSTQATELRARAAAGEVPAPHLHLAGPRLTAPDGFPINLYEALLPWPFSALVTSGIDRATTAEQARAAVDAAKERFAPEFYKITCDAFPPGTPKLTAEAMTAAIARAKELGVRPTAHVGTPEDVMLAAEAGLALFAHPPSSGVLTDGQVAKLASLGVPFVSTLRFLTGPNDYAKDHGSPLDREMATPQLLEALGNRPADFEYPAVSKDLDLDAMLVRYQGNLRDNLKKLFDAGVPIFLGTDAGSPGVVPGASLHRELRVAVEAGLSPTQALKAATSAPADFLDPAHRFGRVAPGQRADLLLVNGDPTQDIAATEAVAEVFFEGRRLLRTTERP